MEPLLRLLREAEAEVPWRMLEGGAAFLDVTGAQFGASIATYFRLEPGASLTIPPVPDAPLTAAICLAQAGLRIDGNFYPYEASAFADFSKPLTIENPGRVPGLLYFFSDKGPTQWPTLQ